MIKDRVMQILKVKGIAKEEFCIKIGMTSANFRGNAKTTPLNSDAIENILSEIPEINAFWLLTGEGEMLKINEPEKQVEPSNTENTANITMPREVFDLVVSQQKTIESQQKAIEKQSKKTNVEGVKGVVRMDDID